MNFKAHLATATVFSIGIGYATIHYNLVTISNLKTVIPAVVLGGLWPDTDTKSIPTKLYCLFLLIASIYWYAQGTTGYTLLFLIPFLAAQIDKHRGWTHSLYLPPILFFSALIVNYLDRHFISMGYGDFVETESFIIHWGETKDFLLKYSLQIQSLSVGILFHDIVDIISTFLKRKGIIKSS